MFFPCYGSRVKGYKLWNHETKRILMSKSVVFNESVMYHDSYLLMIRLILLTKNNHKLVCRWSTWLLLRMMVLLYIHIFMIMILCNTHSMFVATKPTHCN